MALRRLRRTFGTGIRWYAGLILCAFSLIPGWIEFKATQDAIENARTIDGTWVTAILVCSALCYFLLLVAYRAFTGRGREQDGGLLPPTVLQMLCVVFGVFVGAACLYALFNGHWPEAIHGFLGVVAAAAVFRIAQRRKIRLRALQDSHAYTDALERE